MPRAPFPAFDIDPKDPAPDGLPFGPVTAPKRATLRAPVSIGQVIKGMEPPRRPSQAARSAKLATNQPGRPENNPVKLSDAIKAALHPHLWDYYADPENAADLAVIEKQVNWRIEVTAAAAAEEKQRAIEEKPISHFPLLSLQAIKRKGARGGYRLWLLARALDEPGRGMIAREDLKTYAEQIGIEPRTWQRWIAEARAFDLLTDIQQAPEKGGAWMFIIAGLASAAHALRCDDIGKRKASIPAVDLIGEGWRARVWASYEQLFMQKPITRERMQKIANVPVSTQRYRDNQAGVKRVRSYAKTTITKDYLPGLQEHSTHKGLFVRRDGFISWRLPNIYIIDWDGYTTGARGRARKANKKLKQLWTLEGLSLVRQALTSNNELDDKRPDNFYRLFNTTDKQFKATRRKIHDLKPSGGDLYAFPKRAKTGALMWEHANVTDYTGGRDA